MEQPRVFQIANEFRVDTRTVLDALHYLGEDAEKPESKISEPVANRVRAVLSRRFLHHTPIESEESQRDQAAKPLREPRPSASTLRAKAEKLAAKRSIPKHWRDAQREAVQAVIPEIYAALRSSAPETDKPDIAVVFHNGEAAHSYGICTLSGEQYGPLEGEPESRQRILAPLREAHAWYRTHQKDAPNVYVAFDLAKHHVWIGRSLESIQDVRRSPVLHAETLEQVSIPTVPTTGEPPHLALKAQEITPQEIPSLKAGISDGDDRPEEAFLLHVDLLRLAVDSLDGAELLAPLPIHVNGVWVFSRPIIMQRSDGSDRHVRAVWFRQGEVMWRIRTYTAGRKMNVKQVGEQLAGRKPFVPVWDDTRPEQKLLAAIWALMSQGGITETERTVRHNGPEGQGENPPEGLTLVRVKAGTDHAAVYGPDGADGVSPRAAYSVRGHYRHQPYPSLGRDENGRVRTKPIWIVTYTKGTGQIPAGQEKVLLVHP